MRRIVVCFAVLLSVCQFAYAQQDSAKVKKPWYLTMGTDIKVKSLQGKYNYFYAGEYSPRGNGDDWIWRERRHKIDNIVADPTKFYDIKMDVLLSRNRSTKFGLSYNFGILDYGRDTVYRDPYTGAEEHGSTDNKNLSFIAITGLFEYTQYFKSGPVVNNPFAYGSIAAGFYRATEYNGGPGNEYFTEARMGVGYHFQHDWMIKLWMAQSFLLYREHQQSQVFDRQQTRNIDMNITYMGIGFAKQFELIPD
ncbi:MAG: hypothetical protein ACXWDO_03745 [Bacteroidia bacterium]